MQSKVFNDFLENQHKKEDSERFSYMVFNSRANNMCKFTLNYLGKLQRTEAVSLECGVIFLEKKIKKR